MSLSAMEVAFRGVRKVLCVAEKNDAAKGIADLLSNGRMRRVRRRIPISSSLFLVMGAEYSQEGDFSHFWVFTLSHGPLQAFPVFSSD